MRSERGIQGRFRIINTCSYPVEASWCANDQECAGAPATGNLWTLFPGGDWPIVFADLTDPKIEVGGCRTEKDSVPWPSDAAINRAGGIYEGHNHPPPAAGVNIMPRHLCK